MENIRKHISFIDYIIKEDGAPTNSVGGGQIAGMGVNNPNFVGQGEPGVYGKRRKNIIFSLLKRKKLKETEN